MTAGHAMTTGNVAAAIGCHNSEFLSRLDGPNELRVVLAHDGESLADPIVRAEFLDDAGPDAVLLVFHQGGVADNEHAVLGARKKDVGAVGRLEEADPSRCVGVVGDVVSDQRNDDDLGFFSLECMRT